MSGNSLPNCCLMYGDRYVEIRLYGPAALAEVCAGVADHSRGVCPRFVVSVPRGETAAAPVQCLGGPFDGNEVRPPQVLVGSIGMRPALSISASASPHRPSVYRWDDSSFRFDAAATVALRHA